MTENQHLWITFGFVSVGCGILSVHNTNYETDTKLRKKELRNWIPAYAGMTKVFDLKLTART